MQAFISHISEEAKTAIKLKKLLDQDFLGMLNVFVSSDGESIAAGEDWLNSINEALSETQLFVVLCSPVSIRRPWINFEAGAAWMLKVPVIPLCHAGLKPRDLPMPLSLRQGLSINDPEHLRRFYVRIAEIITCRMPNRSFDELANELSESSETVTGVGAEDDLRELEHNRAIRKRLNEALNNPKFKWRSLERLSFEAGISQDIAADLLRADDSVRFSKGESGNIIVGLRSRVG